MTSPSSKPLASAEHSSDRAEAAQALEQLHTQPPSHSSAEATPFSSVPPSPHVSLAYGSPFTLRNDVSTRRHAPGPRGNHVTKAPPQEPPKEQHSSHKSAKRPHSPSEHRSQKLRRDNRGTHPHAEVSTTPAERNVVHRDHGSNRAPATGPPTMIQSRELPHPSARRHAGRARKDPLPSNEDQLSSRHDEPAMWNDLSPTFHDPSGASSSTRPRSRPSHGIDFSGPQPAATPASPYDPRSAGFHRHLTELSPRLPPPTPTSLPPGHLRPDIADYALRFSNGPSVRSLNYPNQNASPNVPFPHFQPRPIPPPLAFNPTQSRLHGHFPPQTPSQDINSAEFGGFKILRNAVQVSIVRELTSVVSRRLPVNANSETHQAYVTPFPAYQLRDDFNSVSLSYMRACFWLTVQNCRDALQDFYIPMQKKIPAMPKTSIVGSFLPGDPREARYSLLHVGNKDQIYVHIALNRLCWQSGFYNILKGSHLGRHPSRTPVNSWSSADINLEEGDAIIWRGDLAYFLSPGGGGKAYFSSCCLR